MAQAFDGVVTLAQLGLWQVAKMYDAQVYYYITLHGIAWHCIALHCIHACVHE